MPVAAYAFLISFALPGLIALAAIHGGPFLAGVPIYAWGVTSILDRVLGRNEDNPDTQIPDRDLFWHRLITIAWAPIQTLTILGCLYAASLGHLPTNQQIWLFAGLGVATGSIGINYAHELIHQRPWIERMAGEWLLSSVFYGHFTTEHLYNHHLYVATPKDPVTARYNEGFWRFLPRAVIGTATSAWAIDAERQRRRGRAVSAFSNPWWTHMAISLGFLGVAFWLLGWWGVLLYLLMCVVAIVQLEAVNYVEHYGLTREHLGGGKYEHTKPHHSWNATQAATNLFLINLQRHSDHHYKPDRRYPLLQTYDEEEAPHLPFGYPLMVLFALTPPLWFRVMNRRVKEWRKRHYPHIKDWSLYKAGLNPLPR